MITDFNRIVISVDRQVCALIVEKYGFNEKFAIEEYLKSETYKILIDKETAVYKDSPVIVFEMWEAEKITGNPRNSRYIRGLYE